MSNNFLGENKLVKKQPNSAGKVILGIVMFIFAFFFFYPMIYVVVNSFRPNADIILTPLGLPKSFYVGNYVKAWNTMQFPKVFLNTLLITVFGVAGIILTSAMAAYMLARTDSKLSWLLYGFFAFSIVIPFQIIMVPIGVLASDLHLMNSQG